MQPQRQQGRRARRGRRHRPTRLEPRARRRQRQQRTREPGAAAAGRPRPPAPAAACRCGRPWLPMCWPCSLGGTQRTCSLPACPSLVPEACPLALRCRARGRGRGWAGWGAGRWAGRRRAGIRSTSETSLRYWRGTQCTAAAPSSTPCSTASCERSLGAACRQQPQRMYRGQHAQRTYSARCSGV